MTVEAMVNEHGKVRLLAPLHLPSARRALLVILEPGVAADATSESALLSEAALAEDWLRPEEEAAWSYLQPAR